MVGPVDRSESESPFHEITNRRRPNSFDGTEPNKFARLNSPDSLKRRIEELAEEAFKRMKLDEVSAFLELHAISKDNYYQQIHCLQLKYPFYSEYQLFQLFKSDVLRDKEFSDYLSAKRIDRAYVVRMLQNWTARDPTLENADLYCMFRLHVENDRTQDYAILCPYKYSMRTAYFR